MGPPLHATMLLMHQCTVELSRSLYTASTSSQPRLLDLHQSRKLTKLISARSARCAHFFAVFLTALAFADFGIDCWLLALDMALHYNLYGTRSCILIRDPNHFSAYLGTTTGLILLIILRSSSMRVSASEIPRSKSASCGCPFRVSSRLCWRACSFPM